MIPTKTEASGAGAKFPAAAALFKVKGEKAQTAVQTNRGGGTSSRIIFFRLYPKLSPMWRGGRDFRNRGPRERAAVASARGRKALRHNITQANRFEDKGEIDPRVRYSRLLSHGARTGEPSGRAISWGRLTQTKRINKITKEIFGSAE